MDFLLLAIRVCLFAVFAVAGVAKLLDLAGTRKSITGFGVRDNFAPFLSIALPVAELAAGVALIPVAFAWWGAILALALLSLFLLGISVNLARGRNPDCHCFGQLHSAPLGWRTLIRNAILAIGALLAVLQGPEGTGASIARLAGIGSRFESAILASIGALSVVSVLQFWFLFHALRQNGRLLSRIEAVEMGGGSPVPASAGLPIGSPAPSFRLTNLDGEAETVDSRLRPGRTLLLVFFEPGCGGCEELLPEMGEWQSEYESSLSIIPISGGDIGRVRERSVKHGLRGVLLQQDGDVSDALLVRTNPSAVAVANGKIASPLATGGDAVRQLVYRSALPRAKKGDRTPAIPLPDLDGGIVDLGLARGRRTLVLFWSPFCGYCQRMLHDLLEWEKNRPPGAPELLVVSSGSAAQNRNQGFTSPVLLDPYHAASHVFGVYASPSAVLLDEEGGIISDVVAGRNEAFALGAV